MVYSVRGLNGSLIPDRNMEPPPCAGEGQEGRGNTEVVGGAKKRRPKLEGIRMICAIYLPQERVVYVAQ